MATSTSPPARPLRRPGKERCHRISIGGVCMFEPLEPRRLLSSPIVNVTARGAGAYESGPTSRFFYIRRDGDISQPLIVSYTVGGKATQGSDYLPIGDAITIKSGRWLRRVEVKPID